MYIETDSSISNSTEIRSETFTPIVWWKLLCKCYCNKNKQKSVRTECNIVNVKMSIIAHRCTVRIGGGWIIYLRF